MSDCCSPGTGFPSSTSMQQLALNHPVIWEEICMIQQAILAAASQCQVGGGQMCTTFGGATPMTFISGITGVTVTSGGTGYFNDTPSVYFEPPVGAIPSVLATGTVTTNGGNITGIVITAQGLGYAPIPATMAVSSLTGTGAIIEPLVNAAGGIVGVNIIDGGLGYTVNDAITATRAVIPNIAYVNATFRITTVALTGEILAIAVLISGSGYQPSVTEAKIVSTLNPNVPYPLGTGFMSTVLVGNTGAVTQVVVSNTGAGYSMYRPYLVITDPGSGAQTTVNLTGTAVSSITVNMPGMNYTQSASGTVFNPPTAALPNPPASPAVVDIVVSENTFGTNPNLYYQVWATTVANKQIQTQLNQVVSYFKGLGYSIIIQTNPATGTTLQWKICW
jgi:hypothetical protein